MKRLVVIAVLPLLMWGCATRGDLWRDLNRASRPASEGVCQTRLAVIGEIQTPEEPFYVAEQSLVLTGRLAPRGIHEPFITREKRYGSSGGIEDDPWKE